MPQGKVPPISDVTLRFFTRIVQSYFRRHFRAVLIQNAKKLQEVKGPLIVYANHASWWDPMVSVLLAQTLLPERKHYAPMDAVPLKRYPILRKIGIFPVEMGTPRGATWFLRHSEAILKSGGVLWVTPQGRFADVREKPVTFKPGLAALLKRVPDVTLLPLAIEYTFWNERLPETLLRVGPTVEVGPHLSLEKVTSGLECLLDLEMKKLCEAAIARDPSAFDVLLEGGRGTGGFYALGKRLRALVGGKGFQEDHSARDAKADEARR
jgi:1-acyl-sn-glycerol-3-phosphate acyltransferase